MNALKDPIDLSGLQDELHEALKAEELYQLQNDAKLRAIEQRVPTYDHFREMVNAAHLRPLERSDIRKKPDTQWNSMYNTKPSEADLGTIETCTDHCTVPISDTVQPKSSTDFVKIWNKISNPTRRIEYLLRYKCLFSETLFCAEIPSEFLGQVFQTCLEVCSEDTSTLILETLSILSMCNRFNLSLQLLSESEKMNGRQLFENLKKVDLSDISSDTSLSSERFRESLDNTLKMYATIL